MAKKCISCGMPLENPEHFPLSDESKDYCVHCARPDGSMKSYEEAMEGMAAFLERTQGIQDSEARQTARAIMARMPAWMYQAE